MRAGGPVLTTDCLSCDAGATPGGDAPTGDTGTSTGVPNIQPRPFIPPGEIAVATPTIPKPTAPAVAAVTSTPGGPIAQKLPPGTSTPTPTMPRWGWALAAFLLLAALGSNHK